MTKRSTVAALMAVLFILGGCASPRSQVEKGLRSFGMPKPSAKCMAHEMNDRLHKKDMKALERFLKTASKREDARPSRVIAAVERLDDPGIVKAATKASISCTILR